MQRQLQDEGVPETEEIGMTTMQELRDMRSKAAVGSEDVALLLYGKTWRQLWASMSFDEAREWLLKDMGLT